MNRRRPPMGIKVISPADRKIAELKLERIVYELQGMGLPCIALTFGVTPEGTPDVIMVSDAVGIDKTMNVLGDIVDAYRGGASNVEIMPAPTGH